MAVASTKRGNYETIPDTGLLAELGKRVKNRRIYKSEFEKIPDFDVNTLPYYTEKEQANLGKNQPYRTDFEKILDNKVYVDLSFG